MSVTPIEPPRDCDGPYCAEYGDYIVVDTKTVGTLVVHRTFHVCYAHIAWAHQGGQHRWATPSGTPST